MFCPFLQARKFKQRIQVGKPPAALSPLNTDDYGWIKVDMGKPKFEAIIPFYPKTITKFKIHTGSMCGTPVTSMWRMGNLCHYQSRSDVLTTEWKNSVKAVKIHFRHMYQCRFMQVMNITISIHIYNFTTWAKWHEYHFVCHRNT